MTTTRNGQAAPESTPRARRVSLAAVAGITVLAATACSAVALEGRPEPHIADGTGDRKPGGEIGNATPEDDAPDSDDGRNAAAGPLNGMTVVIDPGHNGGNADAPDEINRLVPAGPSKKECDTVGSETDDGYAEHAFTWDFSQRLAERLEADGATVVLTRDDDEGVGPCIDERARIGNAAEADAAISIHADGGPSGGRGFHLITPGKVEGYTEDIVEPSRRLAEEVRAAYREGSGMPYADYLATDGLDERTDLGGLNLSTVPKVFLEAGNLRNASDAAKLTDGEWREEAAAAVADGISRYLRRD
ncbi:N-acetylmuramoyl-L-alanine amidase [Nocardiopsis mwathae]|uniref:N-acetylmuramoyl-L-alanine amidase n=1 Tax=Nocardiopsis mwathae TaxID=1472723 RepID=A0A7W9YKX8_9ACTN|nr:N-acetylmuramoyl-L-alanine amidase [Nocardiopsis mwathae]MBB6173947.1 N-acetylmuramoyl-L-alanine amidase [Nocardiopsis mwathae]